MIGQNFIPTFKTLKKPKNQFRFFYTKDAHHKMARKKAQIHSCPRRSNSPIKQHLLHVFCVPLQWVNSL